MRKGGGEKRRVGGLGPRAPLRASNKSGVTSLDLSPHSLPRTLLGEAQENEGYKGDGLRPRQARAPSQFAWSTTHD